MNKLPNVLRLNKQKVILCFSIIVTGKCNSNCSYCHFLPEETEKRLVMIYQMNYWIFMLL